MTTTSPVPPALRSAQFIEGTTSTSVELNHFPFLIGRAPECNLVVPQPYVSRRHAEVLAEGPALVVVDAGSRHGTFVNRQRVTRHHLERGDVLQFGSLEGPRLCFDLPPTPQRITEPDLLTRLGQLGGEKSELEKLRWFIEAARQLNSAGKLDQVLVSLLQTTLSLAQVERGFVFLAESDGSMKMALGMDAAGNPITDSSTLSRTVIRKATEGREQFIVTDSLSAEGVVPESIVAHSIRTIICIPLRQSRSATGTEERRRLVGVLYLDSRFQPERFTEIDHELLGTIAREAAALVENAQLVAIEERARQQNEELEIAAGIQQRLMAVQMPVLSFASVEAYSIPCSAVGGDFFDVVAAEHTVCVALVDVSGKGISAAILASTLQGMLYTQLAAAQPLDSIAAATNVYLCTKNVGKYATMLLLRLHQDGRLEYMNCGHVQPRLCSSDVVERLPVSNLPVGLIRGANYRCGTVDVAPGSRLVLVSDGYTEAEDAAGTAFGEDRLDAAASCADVQRILQHMRDFCAEQPASDDCTIVQVAFRGHSTAADA